MPLKIEKIVSRIFVIGLFAFGVSECLFGRNFKGITNLTKGEQVTNLTTSLVRFLAPIDLRHAHVRIFAPNGGGDDYENIRSAFHSGLVWESHAKVDWSSQRLPVVVRNGVTFEVVKPLQISSNVGQETRIQIGIEMDSVQLVIMGVKDKSIGSPPQIVSVNGCRFITAVPLTGFMALLETLDNDTLNQRVYAKFSAVVRNLYHASFSSYRCQSFPYQKSYVIFSSNVNFGKVFLEMKEVVIFADLG